MREYMGYDWYREYMGYDWYEDYEGYRANPEAYVPGAIAYSWLVARVSPSMPVDKLMEASEVLDLVYDYVDQYQVDEFTLPVFKLLVMFDAELKSLVRDFICLTKDYLLDDSSINLIYRYFQFRNPNKYL
jgi:hypothetical protein